MFVVYDIPLSRTFLHVQTGLFRFVRLTLQTDGSRQVRCKPQMWAGGGGIRKVTDWVCKALVFVTFSSRFVNTTQNRPGTEKRTDNKRSRKFLRLFLLYQCISYKYNIFIFQRCLETPGKFEMLIFYLWRLLLRLLSGALASQFHRIHKRVSHGWKMKFHDPDKISKINSVSVPIWIHWYGN